MRGALRLSVLAAASLILADPASARKREVPACWRELGARAAGQLVRDCREASPMTAALCRPDVSCDTLRELIAEACRALGSEARSACANLEDEDDDDEDPSE